MSAGLESIIGAYTTAIRCSDFELKCPLCNVKSGIVCYFEKSVDLTSGSVSQQKL